MARICIDDLPLGENLTLEEEQLILGAGRQTFRPALESLENREMMDAGIGGALMQQLPNFGQGAQIRLLAQETSALQNQSNPLSQSLTQAGQALLSQGQQMNANLHAAADRIFATWSHHVDQVVQNVQGLGQEANRMVGSALNGLTQGSMPGNAPSNVEWGARNFADQIGKRFISDGSKCSQQGTRQVQPNVYEVQERLHKYFADSSYDTGFKFNVDADVKVTIKYEGRVAGVDKYVCTKIEVSDPKSTSPYRRSSDLPTYDVRIFGGVSEAQVKAEYLNTSYSSIGDQQQVARTVYDLARAQMHKIWPGYVSTSILTDFQEAGITKIEGGLRVMFNLNGKSSGMGEFGGHFEFDITCNQSQKGAVDISLHEFHIDGAKGMHTVFSPETLAAFQNNMIVGLGNTWKWSR